MTREEAIIILGNIPIDGKDKCYSIAEYQEAKTMAIKALEQKPKTIQEIQAESEKYQKAFEDGYEQGYAQARFDYEQEPCEDAISRQEALDCLTASGLKKFDFILDARDKIKNLPSVRPQEPFDIETYCKEHFCVMVDKDVWEKAEKALKQEPKTGHNCNEDYADCDQFVCSECGIELQDWHRVERDDDDGEISYHEYALKFCPNCGAKIERSDKECLD